MAHGILLLNMGGPNDIGEVELFLRNMFADPRILPMHPLLRRFVGNRIVKKRLHEAQENYRQLGGRSPLSAITRSLCTKVEGLTRVPVHPAMRYVPPCADEALREFQTLGIDEIVAFPMYPQYSTTTTLSSLDDLHDRLEAMEYRPTVTVIDPYYDDVAYGEIIVDRILTTLGGEEAARYDLILSAHGLPMSIIRAGDPYQKQVESSVGMIEQILQDRGIYFHSVVLAYQSKIGSGAWLEPNLADLLRRPSNPRVLLYPLAFTIDNSETLFELDIDHREIAEKIGYDDYRVAECPNDAEDFARFIAAKISHAMQ
jgi:ferrochelatase